MSKKYTIGEYKYSEWATALGSLAFVTGLIYGISTHKTFFSIIFIALISGAVGFTVGMLIKAPEPIDQ